MNEAAVAAKSDGLPDTGRQLPEQRIVVGLVSGLFGTRGWVKIHSYTRPRSNIASYGDWYLRQGDTWLAYKPAETRVQGNGIVARLSGIDDRDVAAALVRSEIAVDRDALPLLADDEYYWSDLLGLRVLNLAGVELGVVRSLLENGAHDVLEVIGDTTRLIPFVRDVYIVKVERAAGLLHVDWHPDD